MSRIKGRTITPLLSLLLCLSCKRGDGLEPGVAPNLPAEVIIHDGARNVRSVAKPGYARASYSVTTNYPARLIIKETARRLAERGWRPARNDFWNRDYASEYLRGWTHSTVVGKPGGSQRFMAQWNAQWQNARGDVVMYEFHYLSPSASFTNQSVLEVAVHSVNPENAERLRNLIPENTRADLRLLPVGTPPNVETATDNMPGGRGFYMRPDSETPDPQTPEEGAAAPSNST